MSIKQTKPIFRLYFSAITLLLILVGCKDLRTNNYPLVSSCKAAECHPATILNQYPPTSGKHTQHLKKGHICENCHIGYMANNHHKDGVLDKDLSSKIVFFDNINAATEWDNSAGTCGKIACHGQGSRSISWSDDFNGDCTACHAPDSQFDPVKTNGEKTSGKHIAHVRNKSLECYHCHEGYKEKSTHMDFLYFGGKYGKDEPEAIVKFQGKFNNREVSQKYTEGTGACDEISCHGGLGGVSWYDASSGCNSCHRPGSALDPMTTSGSGTSGKHTAHVANKGIGCEICHKGYTSNANHINGTYGKEEASTIMAFDVDGSQGSSWGTITTVFSDVNGQCDNISCHGNSGGVTWYDAGTGCTACHQPGSKIDPMMTSGSGTAGKHTAHVTNRNIGCEVCHEGYKSSANHMNRIYGKTESSTLMAFDTDGSQGSFWGDISTTFTDAGGQCDNISCHGNSGGVTWYDAATACSACHQSGSSIDPMTTSGNGTSGKHTAHVTAKGIGCEVCHEGYKSSASHMNRIYGKTETSTIMAFDTNGSQGSSWGNVASTFADAGGFCDNISCHGNTGGVGWYTGGTGCGVCHYTANSPINPLLTSGSGTNGKHDYHVITKNIDCEICHYEYKNQSIHMNGVYGKAEVNSIVQFSGEWPSSGNPVSTSFSNAVGECNNISCHNNTGGVNWYTGGSGCIACHLTAFSPINPVVTNGNGNNGKHTQHVSNRNIACETCHESYRANSAHMNKTYGKAESGIIVNFDADGSLGSSWGNVTVLYNGTDDQCSNISCHTGSGLDWYGNNTSIGCVICHSFNQDNGDSIPTEGRRSVINEFISSGSHNHTGGTLDSVGCQVCHDQTNHKSGNVELYAQDSEFTGFVNGSTRIYKFQKVSDLTGTKDISDFCLGCHDNDGASRPGGNGQDPFGNGNTPPDVKSRFSGTSWWTDPGTQRRINSHHDLSSEDQLISSSKLECANCHGVHISAKSQPIADPHDTTKPWPNNVSVSGTLDSSNPRFINTFCLACHAGGQVYNPGFPVGLKVLVTTDSNTEVTLVPDDNSWRDYHGASMMSGTCADGDAYISGWMNLGEWVDNSGNCSYFDPPGTLDVTIYNDPACYSGAGYAKGYIIGGLIPDPMECNFQKPDPVNGLRIRMMAGTFQPNDQLVFKYCSVFGGPCAIEDGFYNNGWMKLASGAGIKDVNVTPSGAPLIRGIDSLDYTAMPWEVGHTWTQSHHGLGTKRTQNSVELRCIDCHEYHGSTNYNGTSDSNGNLYMLRDSIDGTGYLDNWDSDSPIDPMVPGRMVNPLVLNLSIFTDQIALDYTPLCNGCHDLSHVGTGGHSGNISCVNCHQHGGSFNGN